MPHPVRVVVTDDLRRSRVTVLFRVALALPHVAWATLWGVAVVLLIPFQWLWALFAGRLEDDVHVFLGRFVRYHVHLSAYVLLLANPWPPFHGRPGYPIDLELDPPRAQRRLGVLLRPALAVPAVVFGSVLQVVLLSVALVGWFAAIVLARLPDGLQELGVYCLRYGTQTVAYLLFLTPAYPSLATADEAPAITAPSSAHE